MLHVPLTETIRAPVEYGKAAALEFRTILVPIAPGYPSDEAMDFACRLAAERRASIVALTAIQVPLDLPLDAELPEDVEEANAQLDEARAIGESYGVRVTGRIARTRNIGRAIVDEAVRRGSEVIVMAGPRRVRLQRGRRQIFGDSVDFVLRHAPCRVMVATAARRRVNALYRRSIVVFGLVAIGLGLALLIETTAQGGGTVGYLLGVLFVALGVGRLYLLRRR